MTIDQFRLLPAHTARWREFFDDPIFASGIVALRDSKKPNRVAAGAAEVESVRSLENFNGYMECLDDLVSLSQSAPLPPEDIPEDWGAEITQAKP